MKYPRPTSIIYHTILAVLTIILIALPIIRIPISVSARGVVRPQQESTSLISMVNGRVINSNIDRNNQLVKQGDTLLVITADALHSKHQYQQRQQQDFTDQLYDLKILTSGVDGSLKTGQYQMELSAWNEKLSEIQVQLVLAEKELKRNSQLYEMGILPLAEYDKSLHHQEQLSVQKKVAKEQQIATWQAQMRDVERQIRTVSNDMYQLDIESSNNIITAPIDGRIIDFSGVKPGNFIVQGQQVAIISPEEGLLAECMVPPNALSLLDLRLQEQIIKSQLYPTITGSTTVATTYFNAFRQSFTDPFLTQSRNNFAQQVVLNLSIPIFDRGRSRNQLRQLNVKESQLRVDNVFGASLDTSANGGNILEL